MAPSITGSDESTPNLTGRAVLSFAQIIVATGALVAVFYKVMSWLNAHHAGFGAVMGATAVYAALLMALVVFWTRSAGARMCMTTTPAAKRYRGRMLIASSVYVATFLLAFAVNGRHAAPSLLAYAAAVLPGVGISGMFVSMGLYLREETDEFQRAVQVESSLWATGAVMMICAIWGFLEMFRLAPHVDMWVVVPIWSLVLGVANVFTRRRYR